MDLSALVERTLEGLGFELVLLEGSPRGRLLRVFIDRPQGVSVEDCAQVSHHLSRVFAAENVDYDRLEVSSPGVERPLKRPADFERFAGETVEIRLRSLREGRRRLGGTLRGMRDGAVVIDSEAGTLEVPLDEIEKARLKPRIDWSRKG